MRVSFAYRYGILGGVATQLANRMQYLRTVPGLEVEFFFLEDHGVGPTLAPYGPVCFPGSAAEAVERIRRSESDVVVVIDTRELLEGLGAPDRAAALVAEVHTTTELGLRYLESRAFTADLFLVPSEYSRRLLADRFGIAGAEVIPNIVDPELFYPLSSAELPELIERPVVAWVGKLDGHKNWELFLEAAASITERRPEVEYWLIGGETAPEETGLAMLHAADGLGVLHRLRWFPRVGYRAMRRVHGYVAASGGCALVTSRDESFGMSVAEALLSGCPVVASRVGALPELAVDRPYLELYPLGDVERASEQVLGLLERGRGARARAALSADLPELRVRLAPSTVGPLYLETLTRAHGLRPNITANRSSFRA